MTKSSLPLEKLLAKIAQLDHQVNPNLIPDRDQLRLDLKGHSPSRVQEVWEWTITKELLGSEPELDLNDLKWK